jgi:hypothetical protein
MLAYRELVSLQLKQLSTKVANQQKAKSRNRHVLQKHGVLTGRDAKVRKAQKQVKEEADQLRRRLYLERITRNKIKNELKARGVIARKQEKERKKKLLELQKGQQFIPIELYKAILDPEKLTTDADIELQLREALISAHGFSTASFESTTLGTKAIEPGNDEWDADYIAFEGLGDAGWNHDNTIDADSAIDPGLF